MIMYMTDITSATESSSSSNVAHTVVSDTSLNQGVWVSLTKLLLESIHWVIRRPAGQDCTQLQKLVQHQHHLPVVSPWLCGWCTVIRAILDWGSLMHACDMDYNNIMQCCAELDACRHEPHASCWASLMHACCRVILWRDDCCDQ